MSSRLEDKERLREERETREAERATADRRQRLLWLLGGVGVLAIAIVAVAIAVSSGGGSSNTPGPGQAALGGAEVSARFKGIPQHGLELGNPKAPVTMVEVADLKCPICDSYMRSAFPTLVDRYVRTGKVKMVMQLQTFVGEASAPGDSQRAARMALATGQQNRLWDFVDVFYLNQQDENSSYATDGFLTKLGAAVPGLDVRRAMSARASPAVTNQLRQADALFKKYGFTGTPSFLLGKNGRLSPFTPASFDAPTAYTGAIDTLLGQ
jgi:protein-disulfide isomerase